jgi:pimeloyl-ACP methyl ester carboxylesterase
MLCPDPAATAAAGVRLITVDRPGYGRSDPITEPTFAAFARDLERLLDHLWLGQIRVVGWACGGQYAAACACVLADRVKSVTLVAAPAPDHELRWLSAPPQAVADVANVRPHQAIAAPERLRASPAPAPDQAGGGWPSLFDVALRVQPEIGRALSAMWAEAFRAGTRGVAADVAAASRPWGFTTSAVRARAALFYGADDTVIGPEHSRWWAAAFPQAELNMRPASGHLLPFVAWPDILRAAADSPPRPHREWR